MKTTGPHDIEAVSPCEKDEITKDEITQDEEMAKKINEVHAMNRTGMPSEIARAVLFLASDDASFCTGHNLVIDGGWTAGKKL